jgi:hypothetical protein
VGAKLSDLLGKRRKREERQRRRECVDENTLKTSDASDFRVRVQDTGKQ